MSEDAHSSTPQALRRRELLVGAGAMAFTAVASAASAGHHEQGEHGSGRYFEADAPAKHGALVAAAYECIATGDVCMSHCLETFRKGDTTMAECARVVADMLAVCRAVASLGGYDSPHLKGQAEVCIAACRDCAEECRKHEKHQPECGRCADACDALIEEARKLTA